MIKQGYSESQSAILEFFETTVSKTKVFKVRKKVDKKQKDLKALKGSDQTKYNKINEQLTGLKLDLEQQRAESLTGEILGLITDWAKKGLTNKKPMFVNTHPVKFTNGTIDYGGLCSKTHKGDFEYLSTKSLQYPTYDLSFSNGILITIAQFLMVNIAGKTIYSMLSKADESWLAGLLKSNDEIAILGKGLMGWVGDNKLLDAQGLKQNYFPTNQENYHLIAPLFASSLCHSIYTRIRSSKNGDASFSLRKAKRAGKYAAGILEEYPRCAIMKFGGTQSNNISMLNFIRHGESYLVPSMPPHWQSRPKPPINNKSLFKGEFERRTWRATKELQKYLLKLQDINSNKRIRNRVTASINEIVDILFNYAAEVQNITEKIGWSVNAERLKKSHGLWLDPYRQDESFQLSRQSGAWQADICADFGVWLAGKLAHKKKMVIANIEAKHWAKLLQGRLREFESGLEVTK